MKKINVSKGAKMKKNMARKFICATIAKITPDAEGDEKVRRIIDSLNFTVALINESPDSFWEEEENNVEKQCSAGRIVQWL